jgi:glucose-6-phosphate isomerase
MKSLQIQTSYLPAELQQLLHGPLSSDMLRCHDLIHQGGGEGSDYLGWVDKPISPDFMEIELIQSTAEALRSHSEVLIVIGIGGSYLGARAAIEMLNPSLSSNVFFAGHHLSGTYLKQLIQEIGDRDVSLNVISKSGTTTEPALAFRFLRQYMLQRYGKEETKRRIVITTDLEKGALREMARREGYASFTVPSDIGGRYSVLTPVGLLPMAFAGIDINQVFQGANKSYYECSTLDLSENPAYSYAFSRQWMMQQGKQIELLVQYDPKLFYLTEWWKQLFGESEGKQGKGLFPANLSFTTDLHSMGQYIQQGPRHLFETVLFVEDPENDFEITGTGEEGDGLQYLEGKTMSFVNRMAMEGTLQAHADGGVPSIILHIAKLNAFSFGYLVYFFMKACAMSAYLLDVNPFDQPGVEAYKQNMFRLLGKLN